MNAKRISMVMGLFNTTQKKPVIPLAKPIDISRPKESSYVKAVAATLYGAPRQGVEL